MKKPKPIKYMYINPETHWAENIISIYRFYPDYVGPIRQVDWDTGQNMNAARRINDENKKKR